MTDIPGHRSHAARIMAALQAHAVDGVVRMARTEMRRLSGVSERALHAHLPKMAACGAIEIMPGAQTNDTQSYRILDPTAIAEEPSWSEERAAAMRANYATMWNPVLVEIINALPGRPLLPVNLKDWAASHGLRKDQDLLKGKRTPSGKTVVRSAVPAEAPAERAVTSWSERRGSGLAYRGFALPDKLPAAEPYVPGRCHWPLACEVPAAGKYCREHRAMLPGRSD